MTNKYVEIPEENFAFGTEDFTQCFSFKFESLEEQNRFFEEFRKIKNNEY